MTKRSQPRVSWPPSVVLHHFRRDVSLDSDRTKIIAHQTADGQLALLLIIDNWTSEVGGAVGYRSKLPLVEFLGRGQVNVEEIRVAAVQAKGRWARRDWGWLVTL